MIQQRVRSAILPTLYTVLELGARHIRTQVRSRPRSSRYFDDDAGAAAARAMQAGIAAAGGARRAAVVEEAVAVCTR